MLKSRILSLMSAVAVIAASAAVPLMAAQSAGAQAACPGYSLVGYWGDYNTAVCQVTMTSNGSFFLPSGVSSLDILLVGGGGGGGGGGTYGGNPAAGGGGGGGQVLEELATGQVAGSTYRVTIGSGGAGGAAGSNGADGGTTSFGTYSAGGGGGGQSGTNGGAGGNSPATSPTYTGGAGHNGGAANQMAGGGGAGSGGNGESAALSGSFVASGHGGNAYNFDATSTDPTFISGYQFPTTGTLWDWSSVIDASAYYPEYYTYPLGLGGSGALITSTYDGCAYTYRHLTPNTPNSNTNFPICYYTSPSVHYTGANSTGAGPGFGGAAGAGTGTDPYQYAATGTSGNAGEVLIRYTVTTTSPSTSLAITASSATISISDPLPTITYSTSPATTSGNWNTQPTCGIYNSSDTTFSTPLTGSLSAGTYVTECTSGSPKTGYQVVTSNLGTLTVLATVPLYVVPSPLTLSYGDPVPTYTYTLYSDADHTTPVTPSPALTTSPTCSSSYTTSTSPTTLTISCSGASDSRYTFNYSTANLVVNAATLYVVPSSVVVHYGDNVPTYPFTYHLTSPTGTTVTSPTGLSLAPTCTSSYTSSSSVASSPLTISCSGGNAGANFTFNFASTATLSILQEVLYVVPSDQSLIYSSPIPTYPFTYHAGSPTGAVVTPTVSTSPVCTSSYSPTSPVSASPLTISCSDGLSTDYAFAFVTGSLVISKATLASPTNLDVGVSGGTVSATFKAVPNAAGYRCTLMYGYNNPSSFTYISATPNCTFAGVSGTNGWGVSVSAVNGNGNWNSSTPVSGFATPLTSPPTSTPSSSGSGGTTHPSVSVYFAQGSSKLSASMQRRLQAFAAKVVQRKLHRISVVGFADPQGAANANLALSASRATAVASFLHRYFAAHNETVAIAHHGGGVFAGSSNLAQDRVATVTS